MSVLRVLKYQGVKIMFKLSIRKPKAYSYDEIGDYEELEDAQERAQQEKTKNPEINYKIEESSGGFNSYGELLLDLVEKG